jgi:hypothetical protein
MNAANKTMLELDFIDRIDGAFPYNNRQESLKMIDEALSISANAVFAVIEEIARIPDEERELVPFLSLSDLLNTIEKKFEHPLKPAVLKTARNMLAQVETDVDEAVNNIKSLNKYPRLYAALNIFYYSSFDESGVLDKAWDDVIKEWDNGID